MSDSIHAQSAGDADLIRICQNFAAAEFGSRHAYLTAPEDMRDTQDTAVDWATLHLIAATRAITPAGWSAKALAAAAWAGDCLDNSDVPLIRSLIQDMAGQAQNDLLDRLKISDLRG
jgi:hypothetical protein